MSDIIISTGEKPKEKEGVQASDIKDTLKAADAYARIKEENDKLEAEMNRSLELIKTREMLGGRAFGGQFTKEKTAKEIADEEAKRVLSMFK